MSNIFGKAKDDKKTASALLSRLPSPPPTHSPIFKLTPKTPANTSSSTLPTNNNNNNNSSGNSSFITPSQSPASSGGSPLLKDNSHGSLPGSPSTTTTTTTTNNHNGSTSNASNVSSSPTTSVNQQSPVLGQSSRSIGSQQQRTEEVKKLGQTLSSGSLSGSGGITQKNIPSSYNSNTGTSSSPYRQSTTLSALTQSLGGGDSSPPSSIFSANSGNSSSPTHETLIYQDNDSNNSDPNTKMGNFVGGLKVNSAGEQPRSGHTGIIFEDTLYIFGGYNNDNVPTNDFFSFNFTNKTWTVLSNSNGPTPRAYHSAVIYNNSMYIFGGESLTNTLKNDVFVYSFDTQLWSELNTEGTKPNARQGHSVVMDGQQMIVYGGVTGSILTNDTYSLNLDTKTWSSVTCNGTAAPVRAFHGVAVHKGIMYVIGGIAPAPSDEVWTLTLATKEWRQIQVEGTFVGRSHLSAVLLQDSIIVTGGKTAKSNSQTLEIFEFDIYQKKWFKIQTTSQGQNRNGHISILKPSSFSIFIWGGSSDTSLDCFSFGKDDFEDLTQEEDGETNRMQNIPKALWESTIMKKYPDLLEMRERTQFLSGVKSYGRTLASPSFTENKYAVSHQFILQLIMEYLERHTQYHNTIKVIEKETGVPHQVTESGESRLVTILRLVRARLRNKNVLDPDLQIYGVGIGGQTENIFDEEVQVVDNLFRRTLESEEDINVWDEGDDNARNIKKTDGEGGKVVIKNATLNKLIQHLAPEKEKTHDVSFMKVFLYSHQSFTTSEILLKKLIQRYSGPTNPADPKRRPEQLEPIRKRVCDVLKYWIDKSPWDFRSGPNADKLVANLNNFIDGALTRDGSSSIKNLRRSLATARSSEVNSVFSTNESKPEPKVPKTIFSPQLQFVSIDELEIARQLTLIEYKFFRNIPPPEFLVRVVPYGEFQYSNATSPNLMLFLNRSNDVAKWVGHSILSLEPKKRAKMSEKFIKIMESLRTLNNFQTLYSIYLGLQLPAVQAAPEVFVARSKEILAEYDTLFSKNDNYKNYRDVLAKSTLPCIPLVSVIQEDIAFIEREQPSMTNTLINFVKRQNLYNIITKAEAYQVHSYNLQPVHQVSTFVNKLPKSTDLDLAELAKIK